MSMLVAMTRSTVKDHQVVWNNEFEFDVTLIAGKDDFILQPLDLRISESNGTRNTEKVGVVLVDLADVAAQKCISRRVLLQETKLNSILKISIDMQLIRGDPSSFHLPIVKSRIGLDSTLEAVRGETLERRSTRDMDSLHTGLEPTSVLSRLSTVGSSEHTDVIDQIFANANKPHA
ncbi:hypothetical protein BSLG_000482 [Batrachochytrium salamandrivorans]|nr:hypothetical protein BSLG_001758 [Batrachochytrium salamandrivorans]KAJ1344967.1 hypothetical protein BSLG_000482 [Batrachochytrium salamandrivorans]